MALNNDGDGGGEWQLCLSGLFSSRITKQIRTATSRISSVWIFVDLRQLSKRLIYFGPILQARWANVTSAISTSAAGVAMLVADGVCIEHAMMVIH